MAKKSSMMNGRIPETQSITPEDREQRIATAAYYRALQRGFAEGDPVEDWLQAEREIDAGPMCELPAPAETAAEKERPAQRSSGQQPHTFR